MPTASSNVSNEMFFGRAWELTINTAPDDSGDSQALSVSASEWDPEALRIRFEVEMGAFEYPWFAQIEIYNATDALMEAVLTQGMSVSLRAGYQTQPYGTIFEGQIYQPIWEQENVVDFKLTLLCYAGMKETIANFANFTAARESTQASLIAQGCKAAHHPIQVGQVDTTVLSQTRLPRARAFFGDPRTLFDDVATRNGMAAFFSPGDGFSVNSYELTDATPTFTYGPTTGLIGSAQETEDGVQFKVLLDARLVITATPNQVKLDMSIIRQRPKSVYDRRSFLDKDGLYIIHGVHFIGDSRGNEWYADCLGVTSVGGKTGLLTAANSNPGTASVPLDPRSAR